MFVGAMTALVTPFKDGHVDEAALARLVEEQLDAGIDGLVPCGTTGEAPTLEPEEHAQVIRVVVETVRRRGAKVPVIAGTGSNSTAHTIASSRAAQAAGADGLLVVTPYYNRPTQEGLYRHFRAIADAVPLPIIVYNIPGRTGCDMSVETLARLAAAEQRIVGVKEATGSVARAQEVVRRLGDRLAVLSGEDALNLPIYAVGGQGCISVVSNVVPRLVADACHAAAAGALFKARELHQQTLALTEALFVETNPIPVKAALAMMGTIGPEIRPPLYAMSGPARERLRAVLSEHGLV
ncbi:MAG TPA: 4-hydroxy-tetrahydrodipicolinate synthase [Polyangia bacterium]|jgi:4-hydroxy-tetrahydrodipicolinate synthase|nr:4-hydroxy-tetrahydrodipicolinate synthase [Polyangia bacterium]